MDVQYNLVKDFLLDIIFPNRCPFCKRFIPFNRYFCDDCIEVLPYVDERVCEKCGKDCCDCDEIHNYDYAFVACYYTEKARDGIINLKTDNATNAAKTFAEILSCKILGSNINFDEIIAVPTAKKSLRKRGYNQALVIAEFISDQTKIPIKNNVLFKIDNGLSQHSLSLAERLVNAKRIFYGNNTVKLNGKNILLCDDVLTTGSTLDACSKILKGLGAGTICVAVAATTPKKRKNILL